MGGVYFRQNIFDRFDVLGRVGVADIDDMQLQVSLGYLYQRRAEGGDERSRQLLDETDCIAEQRLAPIG